EDHQHATPRPGSSQHKVAVRLFAASRVEGWCEEDILDILRGDPVTRDVGDVARAPQHVIDPHGSYRTPPWYEAGVRRRLGLPGYAGGVTIAPEGRRLLRLEVRNAETPIERKPPWIRTRLRTGPEYTEMKALVRREGLHTVCEEAGCPNIYECWEDREATFL